MVPAPLFVAGNSTIACSIDPPTCSQQYTQQGVYVNFPPNPVTPVASLTAAVPAGVGTFTGFGAVAIDPTTWCLSDSAAMAKAAQ